MKKLRLRKLVELLLGVVDSLLFVLFVVYFLNGSDKADKFLDKYGKGALIRKENDCYIDEDGGKFCPAEKWYKFRDLRHNDPKIPILQEGKFYLYTYGKHQIVEIEPEDYWEYYHTLPAINKNQFLVFIAGFSVTLVLSILRKGKVDRKKAVIDKFAESLLKKIFGGRIS